MFQVALSIHQKSTTTWLDIRTCCIVIIYLLPIHLSIRLFLFYLFLIYSFFFFLHNYESTSEWLMHSPKAFRDLKKQKKSSSLQASRFVLFFLLFQIFVFDNFKHKHEIKGFYASATVLIHQLSNAITCAFFSFTDCMFACTKEVRDHARPHRRRAQFHKLIRFATTQILTKLS